MRQPEFGGHGLIQETDSGDELPRFSSSRPVYA
jgi:hypothetical protein